jgi:NADPH-dependent glutamate synthase beta subunit-like oxidoreductase
MKEELWGVCKVSGEPTPDIIEKGSGVAPCRDACPAGINVPRYIRLIRQGKFIDALEVITDKIPFPSIVAHVCPRFCETKCRRADIDMPVAINALKRFVADQVPISIIRERDQVSVQSSGKRVAIIGSGPAGLTAGYYLAKSGHSVLVHEALPEPGGMMHAGIPAYRLPKEILHREIEAIERCGVEIRTNTPVASLDELFSEGYNVVLLAVGAHKAVPMGIEGEAEALDALRFLNNMRLDREAKTGDRVAVIGGGNSAIDASRTALRRGARKVTILYRRSRDQMPAYSDEIEQAIDEGVAMVFLAAPVSIDRINGALMVKCVHMELGESDMTGRPRPIPIAGSEFAMEFDTVIAAIGRIPEIPAQFMVPSNAESTLPVDLGTLATPRDGVFACGDAVTGPASVIEAIAAGRNAAASIDTYLGGSGDIEVKKLPPIYPEVAERFGECYLKEARHPMPLLPVEERLSGFREVELGFDEVMAMEEANRCLMCDQQIRIKVDPSRCVQCGSCQLQCSFRYTKAFNPDRARIALHPRPIGKIIYHDDCIGGCSLCVDSCFFGALEYGDGGN